jgi:hypothetical protein
MRLTPLVARLAQSGLVRELLAPSPVTHFWCGADAEAIKYSTTFYYIIFLHEVVCPS